MRFNISVFVAAVAVVPGIVALPQPARVYSRDAQVAKVDKDEPKVLQKRNIEVYARLAVLATGILFFSALHGIGKLIDGDEDDFDDEE